MSDDMQEYFEYLDELRENGATNMFWAGPYIQDVFGLDKHEARKIVLAWLGSFDERHPPKDASAIDLDVILSRTKGISDLKAGDTAALIAAVQALRHDLAGYNTLFDLARKREQPWLEAWREATGKHDTQPDYGEILAWICDRAEAAEAREAALAGTLEASLPLICPDCADGQPINPVGEHAAGLHSITNDGRGNRNRKCLAKQQVTALAATPEAFHLDPNCVKKGCLWTRMDATNDELTERANTAEARVAALEKEMASAALASSVRNVRIWKALGDRALAAEAHVAELEGETAQAIKWQQFFMNKADSTKAHMAALAGALEAWQFVYPGVTAEDTETANRIVQATELTEAVLAATPAGVMERARAVEEVLRWAKEMCGDGGAIRPYAFEEMEKALTVLDALDALGKEGPELPIPSVCEASDD